MTKKRPSKKDSKGPIAQKHRQSNASTDEFGLNSEMIGKKAPFKTSQTRKTNEIPDNALDGFSALKSSFDELANVIEAELDRPNVWLLQYVPDNNVLPWKIRAVPGNILNWRKGKNFPKTVKAGDRIVYWQAINRSNAKDRGGFVGTGEIISTKSIKSENGPLFSTRVHQFDENKRINRDDFLSEADISRNMWQFTVAPMSKEEATRVDSLIRQKGFKGLFAEYIDESTTISVSRDDAQEDYDALGRGVLAVAFARMLHETWCAKQGVDSTNSESPSDEDAGFVAHIDSPWGGGKTTFANLVARVLNTNIDKHSEPPRFLKNLYPEREKMDGMFIAATHVAHGLKEDKEYVLDEQARNPWIIVPYNAWLNQHITPPWWSFYEAIRRACFKAIREEGIPTVYQDQNGYYYQALEKPFKRAWRHIKLATTEKLWRLLTPKFKTWTIVSLVTVILGWIIYATGGLGTIDKDTPKWISITATAIGAIITVSPAIKTFVTTFTDSLIPGTPEAAKNYSLGNSDPLARFRKHFAQQMKAIERPVLVIIDDIDRCKPEFIVEMTRGLQTILKSPRVVYLFLGDRKWIERAFEVCHPEMKEIDVGPEHSFGGRFVEKAIQLSYVLPTMKDRQADYVRELLMGKSQSTFSIEEEITDTKESMPEGPNNVFTGERAILDRSANRADAEKTIRHKLEPIAAELPNNPRHIKRIINSIYMYQNSLLIGGNNKQSLHIGSFQWCQLVTGIILMHGYAKSWRLLSTKPKYAEMLILKDCNLTPLLLPAEQKEYKVLEQNSGFVSLLKHGPALLFGLSIDSTDYQINQDAVIWLNSIIPQ